MIVVDSRVWIDYFRGVASVRTDRLQALLGDHVLAIGDLMLAEVLQGFGRDRDFDIALRLLSSLTVIDIAGREIAILAARNHRRLRSLGVTVRKTIDTLIATRCISDGHTLLYADRDFDAFVDHLGLVSAMTL